MEMIFKEKSENKFLCLLIKCLHYEVFAGSYGCRNVSIIRTVNIGKEQLNKETNTNPMTLMRVRLN